MDNYSKKYSSFRIPEPPNRQDNLQPKPAPSPSRGDGLSTEDFYEIEYDACPMPGVGKYVLKSRKIQAPERDEIRERFNQMRDIARDDRFQNYPHYHRSNFYDKRVQQDNARIFYKQGKFMENFEDNYGHPAEFSSYFPNYQMMGYEQLRTYFTWRTRIRHGEVTGTSLSYAFLYLYELLNNIGVDNPRTGLEQLMSFWNAFRIYDQTVDKYVLKWLKDYHIYYELPWSFKEFITQNGLTAHYPNITNPGNDFDLYCSISKYDIRKSGFYNDDTVNLIRDCFDAVFRRLRDTFRDHDLCLDNFLFCHTVQNNRTGQSPSAAPDRLPKSMTPWTPFKDALFHPAAWQPDRLVVLSEKEIYVCRQNKWMFNTTITTDSGRRLVGYVLKQMEAVLRKAMNYKYKLSASPDTLTPMTAEALQQAGISLEKLVTGTTLEFYREATKTVVKVDPDMLARIRQEALITQEKLIVPEQEVASALCQEQELLPPAGQELELLPPAGQELELLPPAGQELELLPPAGQKLKILPDKAPAVKPETSSTGNRESTPILSTDPDIASTAASPWDALWDAFSSTERQALFILWNSQAGAGEGLSPAENVNPPADCPPSPAIAELLTTTIKQFADKHNIMLEVLVDGINEKAADITGDSLLDGEFMIYEDYTDQVKGMVEQIWQHKYPQE